MAILYSIYGILKLKGIEESIIMLVFGTIQTLLNKMEGCTGHEQMALNVLISLARWIPADVSWSLTQLLVDQPIPLEKITTAFKVFMFRHGQKIQPHLKTILETLMPTMRKGTTDVEKQCFGQVAEILAETLDKNADCTIELYLYECYTSYKKFYIETSSNKKSKESQLNSLAKILCKLNSERLYPEVRWMLKEMETLRSTEQSIAYTLIEPLRTLIEDASLMPSPNLESLPNLMEVLLCLIGIFKIHKSVEGQAAATACRQLIIQLVKWLINFEGNKKAFLSKLLQLMFEEQKNNVVIEVLKLMENLIESGFFATNCTYAAEYLAAKLSISPKSNEVITVKNNKIQELIRSRSRHLLHKMAFHQKKSDEEHVFDLKALTQRKLWRRLIVRLLIITSNIPWNPERTSSILLFLLRLLIDIFPHMEHLVTEKITPLIKSLSGE
ncbi:hypothetical protein NDU88_005824 [Pleurodeles waltl]|uniref:Uncharacterized protein n=1 Tax=Pleurodeles waltl TaxID=8319 RepID=A0AAV7WZD9_PLEWA|nr:hypothetical protein NDU88_005824 [Pleurodeles waltl]